PFLFHSRLSFALNSKILHPREVIERALKSWEANPEIISLAQIEGFIRQILGWREYMRGIYWAKMPEYRSLNHFRYTNKLPDFFWTGKTKMRCVGQAVRQSLDHAYAHHIQRLMVTGNFAMLAGINPDEVDRWYLGIYIDAVEWVELPNTRGMSQYADGGLLASKPYAASANYLNKMGDHCKHCDYDPKKRVGEKACPFNSFYWAFLEDQREKLGKNPRLGNPYRTWERMDPSLRNDLMEQAKFYREHLEEL
ncbi:MAG: cryptochrome/photolyase family protein, partial [SAR324 cluster bacterium]|nr:cryptochrome/photolyase family protein [SAR324 cluster bacterium]